MYILCIFDIWCMEFDFQKVQGQLLIHQLSLKPRKTLP